MEDTKINIAEVLENSIQGKLLKNGVPANVKSYAFDISKLNQDTKNLIKTQYKHVITYKKDDEGKEKIKIDPKAVVLKVEKLELTQKIHPVVYGMHGKDVYARLSCLGKCWYIFIMCVFMAIIMLAVFWLGVCVLGELDM